MGLMTSPGVPLVCRPRKERNKSPSGPDKASFYVPHPRKNTGGNGLRVAGGRTFSTDAAAYPYHHPGTYTGASLSATQLDADATPDNQPRHGR
jgi:hypothetical protein